ncbi:hypothetical protein B296_00044519 [Ensete ventricosum]|uniref:Uncharacterized protein n=1 Tax=Ensete ventricosum TaxID=4639 RepID=A0A426ZAR9_ENSVE|nr:hypothetical protein B296_00044519 [Ensete ventricosum]
MMIKLKACFSRHSQWPPESFRLAWLESLCCLTLPWMSEIDPQIYSDHLILAFRFYFCKNSYCEHFESLEIGSFCYSCLNVLVCIDDDKFKACFSKHSQ